jgi:hypothetical protein
LLAPQAPPGGWCAEFLAACQPQLQAMSAAELSQTIWALAALGIKPERAWASQFLQVGLGAAAGACRPPELPRGGTRSARRPVPASSAAPLRPLQAAGAQLPTMSRAQLADVPWALASLGYRSWAGGRRR